MPKTHGWPKKLLLILFWILIWQICSMAVKSQILLVGPLETLRSFSVQLFLPDFWSALGFSFVTGACAYWKPLIGEFLDPPIQFMKSIPVASFVILALFWTGAENLSIFISFIVVYPMIHVNTLAGLLSADPKLLEMARVFRVPVWKQAVYIYRGALYPYLKSACRTALGMGLKSGIAAEVIGVPDGSIGEGLYLSKIYLDTADLFAWTITIILISVIFEKGILLLLYLAAGKEAEYDSVKTEN